MRVDEQMVRLSLAENIEAAKRLVMEGRVYQGEEKVLKPSDALRPFMPLSVRETRKYVSRGAEKLIKGLDEFCLLLDNKVCVDIGASTGGFTDVMLRRGADKVYAVDVGYGLLNWNLREHEKVVVMERTNARFLKASDFDPRPSFGATDVSFISLKAILPTAFSLLTEDCAFVALIKPQFEARAELVKKGIVRDPEVHRDTITGIAEFVKRHGFTPAGLTHSPIRGAKGNVEFLMLMKPSAPGLASITDARIEQVVSECSEYFVKSPKGLE